MPFDTGFILAFQSQINALKWNHCYGQNKWATINTLSRPRNTMCALPVRLLDYDGRICIKQVSFITKQLSFSCVHVATRCCSAPYLSQLFSPIEVADCRQQGRKIRAICDKKLKTGSACFEVSSSVIGLRRVCAGCAQAHHSISKFGIMCTTLSFLCRLF